MINGPAKHFIVAEYYTHSNQRKKNTIEIHILKETQILQKQI